MKLKQRVVLASVAVVVGFMCVIALQQAGLEPIRSALPRSGDVDVRTRDKDANYPENVEQLQKPAEKSDGDDAVMLRRQLEKVDSKSAGARNGTRVGEAGGAGGNTSNRTRGVGHQPAGRPPVGQIGRNVQLPSKNRPKGFPEEGNFYNINHKSAASLDRTNQKHAGDKFKKFYMDVKSGYVPPRMAEPLIRQKRTSRYVPTKSWIIFLVYCLGMISYFSMLYMYASFSDSTRIWNHWCVWPWH